MSDPVVKNDATKAIREANPALKLNRIMNCGNGHSINGIGDVPVPILQKGIFALVLDMIGLCQVKKIDFDIVLIMVPGRIP